MNEEKKKILEMLSGSKITVDEAQKLLGVIDTDGSEKTSSDIPQFLRIEVEPKCDKRGDRVKIKVPLKLLRAGMKLAALIPGACHDRIQSAMNKKGIDFDLNEFSSKNVDELIVALKDLEVFVDSEDEEEGHSETVKIYCE